MLGKDYAGQDCAIAAALESIGERWTLLIVRDAFYGVRRFNDFQVHLDIPKAVLSDRLNGLVGGGLLAASRPRITPAAILYELTDSGRELWPVIHALLVLGRQAPASRTAGSTAMPPATRCCHPAASARRVRSHRRRRTSSPSAAAATGPPATTR